MRAHTTDEHLERLIGLEQELDELYGEFGLPRPRFGELSVRRLRPAGSTTETERRSPRALRRAA